jgi:hypothetical protein
MVHTGSAMSVRFEQASTALRSSSGSALTSRACAEASLCSLIASCPANCLKRWWKTRIWWLPRVQQVLDLWAKIHTMGCAIYRVLGPTHRGDGVLHFLSINQTLIQLRLEDSWKGMNLGWCELATGRRMHKTSVRSQGRCGGPPALVSPLAVVARSPRPSQLVERARRAAERHGGERARARGHR